MYWFVSGIKKEETGVTAYDEFYTNTKKQAEWNVLEYDYISGVMEKIVEGKDVVRKLQFKIVNGKIVYTFDEKE